METHNHDRYRLIKKYFYEGYTNQEISLLLKETHGLSISARHVRRLYRNAGLKRVSNVREQLVERAIKKELSGSGFNLGYRAMTKRMLFKYGLSVPRDMVLRILQRLDPEGVENRRIHRFRRRQYDNRGPNYLIHVDKYDKLKRFGFAIHGAICGFSRKILWLRVAASNNDPQIIGSYFRDNLERIQGVPRCVRMDAGTENVILEDIQKSFRFTHEDTMAGLKSVLVGCSQSNQRIERYWRSLRDALGQFWMNAFQDLETRGLLSTADDLHKELARFVFTEILQNELDHHMTEWNSHNIRTSTHSNCLAGMPNVLYSLPHRFDTHDHDDYKIPVRMNDVLALRRFTRKPYPDGCHPNLSPMFKDQIVHNNKRRPTNFNEAMGLYCFLFELNGF